jgi:3-deoxy-D-manno-octulosonic-acid transferase
VRWILYNALFAVAYLAMMPKFLLRMKKRGGYRAHFAERFGRYDPETARRLGEKPRVWVHAVSVGEANLAGQVLKELRRRDPAASFILSTTSSTGRAVCEKLVGPDDVCVYLPLDFPPCVRRALRAANVRAMVLAESELWPNLLRALHRRGVPLVLVNGRVSDRSAPGYRRLRFFFGPVLRLFEALLVQSELDRDRLLAAGAPADRIRVTGSIKFDVAPPAPEKLVRARATLACAGIASGGASPPGEPRRLGGDASPHPDRTSPRDPVVLLGGSTWPGEELALARAWRDALPACPDARLVLVPRHFERAAEVAAELEAAGFRVLRRSQAAEPPAGRTVERSDGRTVEPCDRETILLVDTTGELFALYAVADLVFVGKTLAPNEGGQNMIEPASLGRATIVGPHTENFKPVMEVFRAKGAVLEVPDAAALSAEVARLLSDASARAALGARAAAAVEGSRGALARSCDAIEAVLAAH